MLKKPLSYESYDKKGKTNVATHGGLISIMSDTGMTGNIVVKAIVLTSAQRPLISMSQLDDEGCYVTMGGGGLKVKRGPDQPYFLDLSRLDPQKHPETFSSEVTVGDIIAEEKRSLYSIPLDLVRI